MNEGFERHIRNRVADAKRSTERQLHNPRLEKDIQYALSLFEIELKRDHDNDVDDINSGSSSVGLEGELPRQWIPMQGLEPDPEKGLREDGMSITRCVSLALQAL